MSKMNEKKRYRGKDDMFTPMQRIRMHEYQWALQDLFDWINYKHEKESRWGVPREEEKKWEEEKARGDRFWKKRVREASLRLTEECGK